MKEIGVYIHIPFCKTKCSYCDFVSYADKQDEYLSYKNMLVNEINNASWLKAYKIKSIFIGGGTPSILPANYIEVILLAISQYNLKTDAEITIEANPGTITKNNLSVYKSSGINRLSIGLQSHDEKILKILGRIHDYDDFINSYENAKQIGFKNISADLMFSLPNQSIKDFETTLEKVTNLDIQHISAYSLIVEDNTPFGKMYSQGVLKMQDDHTDRQMYYLLKEKLDNKGFKQYEISNFAKGKMESVHNKIYWQRGDYIGFGVAAHSFVDGIRFSNTSDFEKYLMGDFSSNEKYKVTQDEAIEEEVFLKLRMTEGIDLLEFENRYNKDIFHIYGDNINFLIKGGYLEKNQNFLFLTDKGVDVSNTVFSKILT